jgi:tetratricopeptide (TPR) repeat protein
MELSRLEPAEHEGLVRIGHGEVAFHHPLVRAAVYANADAVERREAHRVLADALYDSRVQGRRAWLRALATVEPDETELWLQAADIPPAGDLRAQCAVGEALFSAGEDERPRHALAEAIETARASSALGLLPYALQLLALVDARRGRLSAAAAAAAEAHELATALDQPGERLMALAALTWIEALLGHEGECRQHVQEAFELNRRLGREISRSAAEGMLELSLGHFDDASKHFEAHLEEVRGIEADAFAPRSFAPNLIEAYIRTGRREEARVALATYEGVARRSGRPCGSLRPPTHGASRPGS